MGEVYRPAALGTGRIRTRLLVVSGSGENFRGRLRHTCAVAAVLDEVDAVRRLHELNAEYIRAFVEADAAWYAEHLAEDFTCTRADGHRIGKAEFLRLTAEGPEVTNVSYDEVDVRPLGGVALVQGVTHYVRDGSPQSTRYTDVWRLRGAGWEAVAAHLTCVCDD
jgi:ketosteroid isomerase-like protein